MEIVFIIILGIVLYMGLHSFRSEVKRNMKILNNNIINLRKEMETLKIQPKTNEKATTTAPIKPVQKPTLDLKPLEVTGQRLAPLNPKPTEKPIEKPVEKPIEKIEKPTPVDPVVLDATKPTEKVVPAVQPTTVATSSINRPAPSTPNTNKKKNRDYEKLIGENWLNKIGIAILVIGIGFFVRYAIDKNWISEWGRVGIGLLTGGILIGIAHYLRKRFKAFSSVLIGGGISIFYYTISIAFHDYQLFNQTAAFAIMVGITIFSSIIAVIYDRKELAIIALIGGFTSPFMVQNGAGNYIVFFTYIAILNSGLLLLSYFKKWGIISKLALGFTVLFFGGWMLTTYPFTEIHTKWAVFFISLFYIQFLAVSLIYNFVRRIKFNAWEFIQLTSITVLYYGGMMYLLNQRDFNISPAEFTVIMSVFYVLLAVLTQLRKGTDKSLSYLMIGKAVSFVTLSGGILFDGDYMTLFWAIEGVILLIIAYTSKLKILCHTSILLNIISILGLIRKWTTGYLIENRNLAAFSNGTFLTGIFVIGCLVAIFLLVKRIKTEEHFNIKQLDYLFGIGSSIFALSYLVVLFELIYQLNELNFIQGKYLILWIFHLVLLLIGGVIAYLQKRELPRQIFIFFGSLATLAYLAFAQLNNLSILYEVIASGSRTNYYYLHFGLTVLVIGLLFMLRKGSLMVFTQKDNINWFLTGISIVGIIIATVELDQILGFAYTNKYSINTIFRHTRTEGYTILWGIYSFIVMLFGMKQKNQIMRILALVIFSVTLLKLFIFDIQNISEAGKIVAFISLGVLLLVISFMYQKLKALIVGEAEIENPNAESVTK